MGTSNKSTNPYNLCDLETVVSSFISTGMCYWLPVENTENYFNPQTNAMSHSSHVLAEAGAYV